MYKVIIALVLLGVSTLAATDHERHGLQDLEELSGLLKIAKTQPEIRFLGLQIREMLINGRTVKTALPPFTKPPSWIIDAHTYGFRPAEAGEEERVVDVIKVLAERTNTDFSALKPVTVAGVSSQAIEAHRAAVPRIYAEKRARALAPIDFKSFTDPQALQSMTRLSTRLLQHIATPDGNALVSTMDIIAMLKAVGEVAAQRNNLKFRKEIESFGLFGDLSFFTKLSRALINGGLIKNFRAFLIKHPLGGACEQLLKEAGEVWGVANETPQAIADAVNQKVREETNGLINKLVKPKDFDYPFSFGAFSTTYYLGAWKTPFERESHGDFTRTDGTLVQKTFLVGKIYKVLARQTQTELILIIPLEKDVQYVVRMPNTPGDLVAYFDPSLLTWAYNSQTAEVWLPKLDVSANTDLLECLKKLGMASLGSDIWKDVKIKKFIQNVRLITTKKGVEAAAATFMGAGMKCAPPKLSKYKINKPHSIAIVVNGLPLFSGYIGNPTC